MTVTETFDAFANTPVPEGVVVLADRGPVRFIESHAQLVGETGLQISVTASQRPDGSIVAVSELATDKTAYVDGPTLWIDVAVDEHLTERLVLAADDARQLMASMAEVLDVIAVWSNVEPDTERH